MGDDGFVGQQSLPVQLPQASGMVIMSVRDDNAGDLRQINPQSLRIFNQHIAIANIK